MSTEEKRLVTNLVDRLTNQLPVNVGRSLENTESDSLLEQLQRSLVILSKYRLDYIVTNVLGAAEPLTKVRAIYI